MRLLAATGELRNAVHSRNQTKSLVGTLVSDDRLGKEREFAERRAIKVNKKGGSKAGDGGTKPAINPSSRGAAT